MRRNVSMGRRQYRRPWSSSRSSPRRSRRSDAARAGIRCSRGSTRPQSAPATSAGARSARSASKPIRALRRGDRAQPQQQLGGRERVGGGVVADRAFDAERREPVVEAASAVAIRPRATSAAASGARSSHGASSAGIRRRRTHCAARRDRNRRESPRAARRRPSRGTRRAPRAPAFPPPAPRGRCRGRRCSRRRPRLAPQHDLEAVVEQDAVVVDRDAADREQRSRSGSRPEVSVSTTTQRPSGSVRLAATSAEPAPQRSEAAHPG